VTQDKQNPSVFQRIQLYTVSEAADALHLHPSTVRRLIRAGDLPVVRIGAAIRIDPEELRRFIDARRFRRVVTALRSNSWVKVMRAWERYESGG
jgi:excisionase family DNA binding protein